MSSAENGQRGLPVLALTSGSGGRRTEAHELKAFPQGLRKEHLCPSAHPPFHLCPHTLIRPPICPSVCPPTHLSTHSFTHHLPSFHLSICPSVHPLIRPPILPCVHLFRCSGAHLCSPCPLPPIRLTIPLSMLGTKGS